MGETRKVLIVPCSGIGKSYGSVSREAAYQVTEDDRPESTQLVPLALLVLGDDSFRAALIENPAITLDGCKLACATKMVQACGGQVAQDFSVLDAFRAHRDCKPQGIAVLNEGGLKLAGALAEAVDVMVDRLTGQGGPNA